MLAVPDQADKDGEETGDTLNGSDGPIQSAHEHSDNPPSPDEAPDDTKPKNDESEK
jgi:hypothetical protein